VGGIGVEIRVVEGWGEEKRLQRGRSTGPNNKQAPPLVRNKDDRTVANSQVRFPVFISQCTVVLALPWNNSKATRPSAEAHGGQLAAFFNEHPLLGISITKFSATTL
jgi:hypothetical protein